MDTFGQRDWKKYIGLFLVLLLIEIVLELVYRLAGGMIFGAAWSPDSGKETLVHMGWLLIVTTPVLYGFVVSRFRKEANQAKQIWDLAHCDDLTGLYNRRQAKRTLADLLSDAKLSNRRFAVLFIDLDRFKRVNDSLGHDVGDEVLKVIAQRISTSVREQDFVARLGGDEFVALLAGIERAGDATEVADRILLHIQEKMDVDGYELHFTGSVGVAIYPICGETVSSVLKSADAAMYEAKRLGKNRWYACMPSVQEQVYSRFQLENDLRRTIRDNDGIFLEYQPQVDVKNGAVVGAEALVRWKHPSTGVIPPKEFIPLAEDTGLIVDLGLLVLRSVCVQIKEWDALGKRPLPISINVSQAELSQPDFVSRFTSTLEEYNVAPSSICIELTETTLMKDMEQVRDKLHQLRKYGIRIMIDDFGTGYNSLAMLRDFPVDEMKIDITFVSAIHMSTTDRSVFSALVTLAHASGLGVVAEGVEVDEQLSILREENCDEYQGFLFSRPMSAEKFAERYTSEDRNLA